MVSRLKISLVIQLILSASFWRETQVFDRISARWCLDDVHFMNKVKGRTNFFFPAMRFLVKLVWNIKLPHIQLSSASLQQKEMKLSILHNHNIATTVPRQVHFATACVWNARFGSSRSLPLKTTNIKLLRIFFKTWYCFVRKKLVELKIEFAWRLNS